MYTLTKNQNIMESIALQKEDGSVETLEIKLIVTPELVRKYRALQVELLELDKQDKTDPEVIQKIGEATYSVLSLLLGEENTNKIFAFYENDPAQALTAVFPYIQNEIVPRLKDAVKSRKQALKRRRW